MLTIGNIIWLVFGGFFMCIHYCLAGLLLCLTVIGIPFGIQVFKLAQLSLWPFGREVSDANRGSGCLSTFMNVIWLIFGGIWIAIHHLFWAIILGITIIGIPFAKQHLKLAGLALTPFGRTVQ